MNNQKERYTAPELKLVGDAQDVVLGFFGVGNDLWGEVEANQAEFASDPAA